MFARSSLQLIFTILFILICVIGNVDDENLSSLFILQFFVFIEQGETNAERRRRQVNSKNRNIASQQGNPNGYMQSNNVQYNPNNQQQSINNALSSQGQGQAARSPGFYSSPNFKPPSFSGEKPVGWFETKQKNWFSDQNDQTNRVDGKNAGPSK